MSAPTVLWIRHCESGPTAHIGTSAHLSERCQFLGFVAAPPAIAPAPAPSASRRKPPAGPWYAVLHRFKLSGAYVATDSWCAGSSTARGKALAEERLALWLGTLKFASRQDIHIRPFSVDIDGHTFGLVRENPNRSTAAFRLVPLNLVFQSPWTGYATGAQSAA